jgi:tetratricopeptide (TPR) repeat protein
VELLTGLVQKSLVIWDPDGGRYRLLETIRQYAADRLAGDETEHERSRDAHADCYYRLACTAGSALTTAQQDTWLEVLSHDHDNLRRAIAHLITRPDDAERALRMLTALYRYWMIRANLAEWITLARPLLEHAGTEIPPPVRGRGLVAAALVSIYEDTSLARQLGETALEIGRSMDDDYLRADATSVLAAISHFQGDHDPAAAEQALTLSRRIGDARLLGQALMCYGLAARKDPELARQLYREAIDVTRASGDHFVRYIAAANLATLDAAAGDSERGRQGFEEALELSESLGYDDPLLFSELGLILLDAGDLEGARHQLVSALRSAGTSLYQSAGAIEGIAQYATRSGDWGRAASLYGFVDGAMRTAGMPVTDDTGSLGAALALLREKLGDDDYERDFRAGTALAWEEALDLARTTLVQPPRPDDATPADAPGIR